ncbi:amino acid permease [Cetobacterium sp. SF1]|uniref:amino acid permease n=1 Tax=Cetobacterium sp. SF1 TaxID=3417654 RepID=UPI003CF49656
MKKLSVTSLAMVIFIGVFGFPNIANNFKAVGTSASLMLMIGALIFFLPLCLVMAEFGAYAKDRTAGIYSWIEIGLGKKIAYIAIWSYFVANIFYLPTLATRIPTYLSFVFFGDAEVTNFQTALLGIAALLLALIVGLKFEKQFNKFSTIVGYLSLFVAAIFLVAGIYVYLTGHSSTAITAETFAINIKDKPSLAMILSTFAWIIFAFGGAEICGVYVDKLDNPEKNFPKAILIASATIGIFYVLGILAISTFGTADDFSKVSLVNAVISGYQFMAAKLGLGSWFIRFVAVIYTLITAVALVLWSVALAKSVFSEVPEGTFPEWLTKKDENGVLRNSLIFQTVLALLFIFLTTFGGDKGGALYSKIYDMSTMSFVIPYFFLALSYIIFKKKKHFSPFQAFKNPIIGMFIGSVLLILCLVSLVFSGYDISKTVAEQRGTIELYYGGLLLFLIIGVVIKFFSGKSK